MPAAHIRPRLHALPRSTAVEGPLTTALLTNMSLHRGPLGLLGGGPVSRQGVDFWHYCMRGNAGLLKNYCLLQIAGVAEGLASTEWQECFRGAGLTRTGCIFEPSNGLSSQRD